VLGTILIGLATPTEGGAMGAVGAIALAAINHKRFSRRGRIALGIGSAVVVFLGAASLISGWLPALQGLTGAVRAPLLVAAIGCLLLILWEAVSILELRALIVQASDSTMRINAMVIFILIGATVFGLVFRGVDGDLWIENMLLQLPGGQVGFLLAVNLFVFFLAFFLDYFEIAFIVIPLLAPVAAKLGIDLIWFGVLLGANLQTSFMHPPFGFALFYLRSVAPKEVKSSDIYWGALPWVGLQLILVAIIIFWPGLVTNFIDRGPAPGLSTPAIEQPATPATPADQEDESAEMERRLRNLK
jgi:TRAP-type mannitol/chloroaromatic compound transport system permease large subunit